MTKSKEKVLVKKNYYFILNIVIAIVPIIYETILPLFGLAWGLQVKDETGSIVATNLGTFVKMEERSMISMLASKALVTNIHRREWKLMLFRGKDTKLLENICVSAGDFDVLVKSVMNTRTKQYKSELFTSW